MEQFFVNFLEPITYHDIWHTPTNSYYIILVKYMHL